VTDPIAWYDARADALAARYEAVAPEQVHDWLQDLLPSKAAAVLDVGAGSGRDAAWLASEGYDVVAVEPSGRMRTAARRRYEDRPIQWIADSLPGLERTFKSGLSFDVILLSAVWMHVAPSDRARAFRKLITLLKPGGLLAITLRHGPAEPARGFHPVSEDEIRKLARDHGAFIERQVSADDLLGRTDVRWTHLAIRLPDDGTGALPLLRHIILNDDKSSTYKLGLLRTLCRIADGAGGIAASADDDHVAIPMGLVALTWIRLYKPLLVADLPQNPSNRGCERLGFAKKAFRKLGEVSHHDLRVGMPFTGDTGAALHQAIKDAARTIVQMPVRYMTYPNGTHPILPVRGPVTVSRAPVGFRLDGSYLASFGTMRVPAHLWAAIQRFSAWIEPAIVAEWIRVTQRYGAKQGRSLDEARLAAAMTWSDPSRDVRVPRERAEGLLAARRRLYCVWSGKRLTAANLDIDHCFPWTVWPCGDLWNLMPAHRKVNQHEKRDLLPADRLLRTAQERILDWWNAAYRESPDHPLAQRFALEASASLPGVVAADADLDSLYSALNLQRLRLKQNQQVPEWSGTPYL
jgi:SAM-dependent methyltransferase